MPSNLPSAPLSRTDPGLPRQVAEAMRRQEGTSAEWGLELIDVSYGRALVAMTVTPSMLNGHGSIHGGMLFAFADTAFAYACNSDNVATVAQQASMSFLAPAVLGDRLMASAREEAVVGRSGSYTVTVTANGKIIGIFQGLSRSLGRPVIDLESGESQ